MLASAAPRSRRQRWLRGNLVGVALTCAALAGCTGGSPPSAPGSTIVSTTPSRSASEPATLPTGTGSTVASAPDEVPSADDVRAGTRVRSHGATVWMLPAADVAMTSKKLADGSVRLTFRDRRDPATDAPLAYTTGTAPSALADGSALAGDGGLAPTNASFTAAASGSADDSGDHVLALTAGPADGAATVWFTGSAVAKTSWGDREGGRSLAVTPTGWARVGSLAASELTWTQLVAEEPEADSPTMHEQLSCHELGAPDKATWNLEPWRPDVGALAMISARCNPT